MQDFVLVFVAFVIITSTGGLSLAGLEHEIPTSTTGFGSKMLLLFSLPFFKAKDEMKVPSGHLYQDSHFGLLHEIQNKGAN